MPRVQAALEHVEERLSRSGSSGSILGPARQRVRQSICSGALNTQVATALTPLPALQGARAGVGGVAEP